jgi:hypothetical protein
VKGEIIMGLDWHSTTPSTKQDNEDWVNKNCQKELAEAVQQLRNN